MSVLGPRPATTHRPEESSQPVANRDTPLTRQPTAQRPRFFAAGFGWVDRDARALPRQGRAPGVRLHQLRGSLPNHVGDAGTGPAPTRQGPEFNTGDLRDGGPGAG